MDSVPHKSCTRCEQTKPLSDYQKRKDSKDGHAHWCKACQSAYDRERKDLRAEQKRQRYAEDPEYREKMKARIKRIYATDTTYREATIARATAWDKANPERRNEKYRQRYHAGYKFRERELKSTERYLQQKREATKRRMQDPEKRERAIHSIRLGQYRRRGLLKDAGTFTSQEWRALCNHYGNKCLCCGRSDVPLQVDHIVPIKRYGRNTIDNLQPLCGKCNNHKKTKIIDYRPDKGAHLYKQETMF